MNHPGIIFTLGWLLLLLVSPSILEWKSLPSAGSTAGYVCPPCACDGHDLVYDTPAFCKFCNMPLIENNYPRVWAMEWLLRNESSFILYYHKLFYPAYFLAIFLGLFTVWQYRRDPQTIFFMAFFLSYILYAFKSQLAGTGHSMRFSPRWFFFPGTFLLLAGPALWLYCRQYGERKPQLGSQDWLHFLPALLIVLANLILFAGKDNWRIHMLYNSFDHYPAWAEQLVYLGSGIYYGRRSFALIKHKEEINPRQRHWFKFLVGAHWGFIVLWAFLLMANFYLYHGMATSLEYHLIWLYTALFALLGTYQVIFRRELIFPQVLVREHRLESSEVERLKTRLYRVMKEEKPYLDPELSLQSLAAYLEIKEKDLSELLNNGLNTSFYSFVNTYRLEEVKVLLLDPDKNHLTNFAIAQEAGFSSRSTFFNLFKKHFGTTPGAFKKAHAK